MATRDIMKRIVGSCREAKRKSRSARLSCPQCADGFEEIYGNLLDAIYLMLGEKTETLEESISYTVINSEMTDKECTEVLYTIMQAREALAGPPHYETGEHMVVGYQREAI